MKFKIKDELIELKYSCRCLTYFETATGKTLDVNNFTSKDLTTLFFVCVIATLEKDRKPIIERLDFLDAVDENGGQKCMLDFANWFAAATKAEWDAYELAAGDDKEVKEKPKGKKKQN